MIGCLASSLTSISSPVEYCLVLVCFGFSTILNFSNKISPSCRGEEILKVVPASEKIAFSVVLISFSSSPEYSFKTEASIRTPSISIDARTGMRGISMVSNKSLVPLSPSIGSKTFFSCRVTSASSAAYSLIVSRSTVRILSCDAPFFPIRFSIGTGLYFR